MSDIPENPEELERILDAMKAAELLDQLERLEQLTRVVYGTLRHVTPAALERFLRPDQIAIAKRDATGFARELARLRLYVRTR